MTQSKVMVAISIRIPAKLHDQLEKLSRATGKAKSILVVEAITQYLEQKKWPSTL